MALVPSVIDVARLARCCGGPYPTGRGRTGDRRDWSPADTRGLEPGEPLSGGLAESRRELAPLREAPQRVALDLAHPLAGYPELVAHLG